MPKMKYLQGLADIETHYINILHNYNNLTFGRDVLSSWGIEEEDIEAIKEEKEVLRYLIGCQLGVVEDTSVSKPSMELAHRCFNRHLYFLDLVRKCNQSTVNKHSSKLVIRMYKTCLEYRFKFTQNGWLKTLPEEVLTFEQLYPDFDEPMEIPTVSRNATTKEEGL